MARIDRALFDSVIFPHHAQIPIRFDDLDVQGHVNNAAAIVLMQEARVLLNRTAGLPQLLGGGLRMMVAALQVEFAAELLHPGIADIHNGILHIGRTSFTVAQVARQGGRSAIYLQSVMVMADGGGPTPLLQSLRDSYERFRVP